MATTGHKMGMAIHAARPTLHPSAPLQPGGLRAAWLQLSSSSWGRPAAKAMLLLCILTGLAWLGARTGRHASASPSLGTTQFLGASMVQPVTAATSSGAPPAVEVRPAASQAARPDATGVAASAGVLPDGRVVLNVASESELCTLPGIGPSRAKQIIALRQKMGRFRSVRDLLRIRGIGPRTLKRMKDRLVLDPVEG